MKHAAQVERCAPEICGQRPEIEGGWISGDGLTGKVDEPTVCRSGPRTASRQAPGCSALDEETDQIGQPRVELWPVDPRASVGDEVHMQELNVRTDWDQNVRQCDVARITHHRVVREQHDRRDAMRGARVR